MLVLGLILILLSAGALIAVLASGTDEQAALYGSNVELPTLVIFLAGAATLLLFIMGLELVRSGLKRANATRKNNKKLRKLEKREELRRETRADDTGHGDRTGDQGDHGDRTAHDDRTAPGTTTAPAPGSTGSTGGTGSGTRADGPYETPPPANR